MIPRDLVKKLRKIEIRTARLANDQLAGSYHSVFKGRGMTFSEVRQYQHGDDVRFIDWNVSARMSETFIKVFAEEREMTVMLLVDLSASERFGSGDRTKIEAIAEISALLAFSAIKNNDRVGLILFTDRVEKFVPPKKGRGHVMRVITEILNAKPMHRGTNVAAALNLVGSLTRRRSVAFLISDLIDNNYERELRVAAKRHDLIPVHITDPREEDLPDIGLALFEDLETGALVEIDTSSEIVRQEFMRRAHKTRAMREQMFRRLQIDFVSATTKDDYVRAVSELFRRRERRQRTGG